MTKLEKEIIFDELNQTTSHLHECTERRIKKIGNSYNADARDTFQRYSALRNLLYPLGLSEEYDEHWKSVKDQFHPDPYNHPDHRT
jgi:hypothetical protein